MVLAEKLLSLAGPEMEMPKHHTSKLIDSPKKNVVKKKKVGTI